jgi:peptide/nickel transport system substrate-binding protein
LAEIKDIATNVIMRRALYHGVNRQQLAEVVGHSFSPAADSGLHPRDPLYPQIQSAIPQYPYDPPLAQRMLAEIGWVKGSDGILVNQSTGQRLSTTLTVRPTTGAEKDAAIVADGWKQLGVETSMYLIPPALSDDRPTISTYPFVALKAGSIAGEVCSEVSGPANNWAGGNTIGYCNPRVDETVARLAIAINPQDRVSLTRTLWQEIMTDVMAIPLYFETLPLFALKNVTFSRDAFLLNRE